MTDAEWRARWTSRGNQDGRAWASSAPCEEVRQVVERQALTVRFGPSTDRGRRVVIMRPGANGEPEPFISLDRDGHYDWPPSFDFRAAVGRWLATDVGPDPVRLREADENVDEMSYIIGWVEAVEESSPGRR